MIRKIAVFDLDGTLWKVNSHYELLNLYYKTKFFTSFFYRSLCKFFPMIGIKMRDVFFHKIPDLFINTVDFKFNERVVNLLQQKRNEGYEPVIVFVAPREIIVANAAKRLACSYLCAGVGEKLKMLSGFYKWDELFVCTDNTTDSDLLCASDSYFLIIPNHHIEKKFKKLGFSNE